MKFPKTLYACFVLVNFPQDDSYVFVALKNCYFNLKEIKKDLLKQKEYMELHGQRLLPIVRIIKIKFWKTLPLKDEFWVAPSFDFQNSVCRQEIFADVLNNPRFYEFIITVTDLQKTIKKTLFTLPIAFLTKTSTETIETFMKTADWVVDEKSKEYAIYMFEAYYILHLPKGLILKRAC